jgi:hypothetical protein
VGDTGEADGEGDDPLTADEVDMAELRRLCEWAIARCRGISSKYPLLLIARMSMWSADDAVGNRQVCPSRRVKTDELT